VFVSLPMQESYFLALPKESS